MQTVSIRSLRGTNLRENVRKGLPLAITNHRVLIAVFLPLAAARVEHLIHYNWPHVAQSVVEGEQSLHTASAVVTLDDVISHEDDIGYEQGQVHKVRQRTGSFERLQAALNPSDARQESESASPSVITVRVGDLSAHLIEETGADGKSLAITHDRELLGVVIPVSRSLVDFLVEQNISRIMYNIALSERNIRAPDKMTTLDEASDHAEEASASQKLSVAPKDFPRVVATDRGVADKQQETDMELPTLGQEEFGTPRYQTGQHDPAITADRSVESNATRVFLCHSSSDKPRVRALRRRLLNDEIQPWFDEEDILPGQDWELAIRKAIRASDVVLVCLSRASISKVGYLQKEIKHVLDVADEQPEGTIFLVPVRLEPCDVPERLRRWQWVDLFEENGYPRLLRALRSHNGD